MRERPGQKIKLKTIDEMLGVVGEESAMEIEIEKIHPFRNHPFHVVDDAKMQDLIDSIRENGVLSPTLIRPVGNDEYEMVSGHRRMHAAMKLGMETIPAIIRDMTDDEAIVKMVDSNIQREELLPSEKAFAYKMKLEAMRRTAGRPSNNLSQNGTNFRVDQEIANQVNESRNQIRRYIRLTELIPELLDFVDRRRLQFTVAVEISYIDKEIQGWLFEYIRENGPVKLNQVKELRTALQTGAMTQDKMIVLLNGTQKSTSAGSLTLTDRKLREYFPPTYSHDDMMDVIETLLKSWKAQNGGDSDDV
ncbi:MAG: ParB/RepB/Spo0J family partition protein [Lachnospiraceae bacterium]|nr:ParB/RepB/Spo0J family partition protein [Lachnospiraceae bacterium]